jgi:hypothetical protein
MAMEIQTLIVVLIVLGAVAYVTRLFWKAIRGTRADRAAGCASGGCGCGPAGTTPDGAERKKAERPLTSRR